MITELISEAKKRNRLKSESKVADRIGISRSALNQWKNGGKIEHDNLAILAKLAGANIEETIAKYELSKEHIPEIKNMWKEIAKKATGAALCIPAIQAINFISKINDVYILC